MKNILLSIICICIIMAFGANYQFQYEPVNVTLGSPSTDPNDSTYSLPANIIIGITGEKYGLYTRATVIVHVPLTMTGRQADSMVNANVASYIQTNYPAY